MRGVLFQFSVFSHREQMGVDVVPVSIDINVRNTTSSAIAVTILGHFGVLERVRLDWQKARQFTPAVVLFYVSIFTNSKLCNTRTWIRSSCSESCPLLVLLRVLVFTQRETRVVVAIIIGIVIRATRER